MSHTRDLDELPDGYTPDNPYLNIRGTNHSTKSVIDNSVNKELPWIAISIGISFLSLGLSIGSILLARLEIDHTQERLIETTKQYRLLDNDWQITNAWLATHGVIKDLHGNYEDKNYGK